MSEPNIIPPNSCVAEIAVAYEPEFAALSDADLCAALRGFNAASFGMRIDKACGRAFALMIEAAKRMEANHG